MQPNIYPVPPMCKFLCGEFGKLLKCQGSANYTLWPNMACDLYWYRSWLSPKLRVVFTYLKVFFKRKKKDKYETETIRGLQILKYLLCQPLLLRKFHSDQTNIEYTHTKIKEYILIIVIALIFPCISH